MEDKDYLKTVYDARGTYIVLLAKGLQEWKILSKEEQKKINSIIRSLTKYCNFIQDELDKLK